MPERERHHLFWPVILILAGVALLLDQLEIWTFSWSYVARLWPLILVLAGLDILLSRTRLGGLIFVLLAVAIVVLGFTFLGPMQADERDLAQESFEYPIKGVETADVHLELDVGRLIVSPLQDSSNLFEAEARYDKRRMQVTAETSLDGDQARVHLKGTHRAPASLPGDFVGEWHVRVNPDIPVRLQFDGGVNEAKLDLTGLSLTGLDVDVGVGAVEVLLSAKGPYEAFISGGVGKLTIEVPRTIEARIRLDGGLGAVDVARRFERDGDYYVTEGYEWASDAVDVEIDGGIGVLTLR